MSVFGILREECSVCYSVVMSHYCGLCNSDVDSESKW